MGVCCCLQTFKSVVYKLVVGLVLGQCWIVIFTTDILLYAKVSPIYNVLWECIVVVYTYTTYFGRSVLIKSSDPTCVQNFRPASFTVFEILGFKLKNDDDEKKRRNGLFAISPMFVIQFSLNFR